MLHKNRFLILLVFLALLVTACQPIAIQAPMGAALPAEVEAQPVEPMSQADTTAGSVLPAEAVATIRQIVETRMAKNQIPGFTVAVVQNGEMVYAEGFGVAELGTDRVVTPETVFQLASTSKPITAIAIMQLAEQGKLRLDAPVTDYLPYFKLADEHYQDITIEHLLTHRSGLPDGFLSEEFVPEVDDGATERYVRSLTDQELLFAPGEDWAYSDMGYNILGDVIAKTSGLLFEDYAQQYIFTPLGMKNTTFLLSEVPTERLAFSHMPDESGQMAGVDILPYTRPFAPSDTLYSNVTDMSRLARASFNHGELDGNRILSEASWQQMWTMRTPTWFGDILDNLVPDYAYGWYWGQVADHPVVHHPGMEGGYQNIFLLAPEDDLAVITMGNGLGPDDDFFYAFEVGQDVMKVLFEQTAHTTETEPVLPEGGAYAHVNDIDMYYEIHGEGEPLLVIHGAIGSSEDFAEVTPAFVEAGYQVIGVDCRGRGRSTDSGQPFSYALMASDIVALLDELGIDKASVAGQSDGAIIGLDMAINYPERVNKVVAYGANFNVNGLQPGFVDLLNTITLADFEGMTGDEYRRLAPNPDYLPVLLEKLRYMLLTQPNFTLEQLGGIQSPVLVFDGEEEDTVQIEHVRQLAAAIPNSTLVIQPSAGHHLMYEQPQVYLDTVLPFLAEGETEATQIVPRFEPAECKYPIPEGDRVECGYLVVPEDRSRPDGPTIRVYVMNFKAQSENSAPEPLIVIPGGPGAAGPAYAWLWTASPIADLRANHDNIYIEHRGANLSEPAFYCPEMEADVADLVDMSLAAEIEWSAAAYRACYDRLVAEGHDFSLYGATEAAADAADLRVALGYDKVNVYGVSYGTLPAFYLLRDHPEGVRSMVLDSPEPPEVNQIDEMLNVTNGVLDAIFQACTGDPVCRATYPEPAAAFHAVLAQLREEPVVVTVEDEMGGYEVIVDDQKFVNYIVNLNFWWDDFAKVPAAIDTAYKGDFVPTAQAWLTYLADRHGETGPGSWSSSMGLYNTVECLQDGVTSTAGRAKAIYEAIDAEPSVRAWVASFWADETLGPCIYWNEGLVLPEIPSEPLTSDVPVLILTNTFDSFLPPYFSRPTADQLTNGYFFELPFT